MLASQMPIFTPFPFSPRPPKSAGLPSTLALPMMRPWLLYSVGGGGYSPTASTHGSAVTRDAAARGISA